MNAGKGPRSFPHWPAGLLTLFCVMTVAFLIFRDLTIPAVADVEVWFGFELRGVWARRTAPLHCLIFAAAGWFFWCERPWIWNAAIGYAVAIAISHLFWNVSSARGGGLAEGGLQLLLFLIPAWILQRLRTIQLENSGKPA